MRIASASLLLVAGGLLGSATARAQPPVRLVGDSRGCPAPEAVAQELKPLIPDRVIVRGPPQEAVQVEVWDQDDRYGVVLAGTRRDLVDASRHCDERARGLAVVVALFLHPPSAKGPPRPLEPARPWVWRAALDVSPFFEVAPGVERGVLPCAGLSVRGIVGGRHLALVAGVGALTATWMDLSVGRARLGRFPLDLGLRGHLPLGRFELAGDLGLAATVSMVSGENLASRNETTRLELGLRVAAMLRLWLSERLAPHLAVQALFAPSPFELVVEPVGVVGTTPRFRLAILLGLTVRLL